MVGHKLAEARFHPPYKVVGRRVGQAASFSAANADPPLVGNQIKLACRKDLSEPSR